MREARTFVLFGGKSIKDNKIKKTKVLDSGKMVFYNKDVKK
ncbi:hypothetical protein K010075C41_27380 [Sellimonas intestinalis]